MYMQPNEAIFVQCKYLQSQREKKRAIATLFLHFWLDKTKWREIPRPITRWWDVFTSHMLTRLWFNTLLSFLLIRFFFFFIFPTCHPRVVHLGCPSSINDQMNQHHFVDFDFVLWFWRSFLQTQSPMEYPMDFRWSCGNSGLTYLFVLLLDFKLIKSRNCMFVVVGLICTDCLEFY